MDIEQILRATTARTLAKNGAARPIRIAAQLSLSELASVVGVSPSTLSRWERGERVPRVEAAARYGQALEELTRR